MYQTVQCYEAKGTNAATLEVAPSHASVEETVESPIPVRRTLWIDNVPRHPVHVHSQAAQNLTRELLT